VAVTHLHGQIPAEEPHVTGGTLLVDHNSAGDYENSSRVEAMNTTPSGRIALGTRLDRRRILRYNHNHTSMISGRIGCELAVVTVLCVLMIFFFPLLQGPYPVVNGPATALQAARAAARLRIVIMQGALNSLGSLLISPLVIVSWMLLSQAESRSVSLREYNTVLRC
jgi:hypothetical protein